MDYKKIISSRALRIRIMQLLSFVPDGVMLRLQYRIKMGRKLDLKNPTRFTEKLQYYKLHYRDPLMAKCADKYLVRKYVEKVGLSHILTRLYGVYDSAESIDFDNLPDEFVIKDTLGGGGTTVKICHNKKDLDYSKVKSELNEWINRNNRINPGREWVYDRGKNRIIIEELLRTSSDNGLLDYKFFCFDGKVEFIYVMGNRKVGESVSVNIMDNNFKLLPVRRVGDAPLTDNIKKPENYDEMVRIAEILSKPFPHARIDLYNIDGRIVFGEITFFNASGYMKYDPDTFDYQVGEKFQLRMINRKDKQVR